VVGRSKSIWPFRHAKRAKWALDDLSYGFLGAHGRAGRANCWTQNDEEEEPGAGVGLRPVQRWWLGLLSLAAEAPRK